MPTAMRLLWGVSWSQFSTDIQLYRVNDNLAARERQTALDSDDE